MPFPFFPFLRRRPHRVEPETPRTPPRDNDTPLIKRHFYNERGFQTYASFFAYWGGHITAGHAMTDCGDKLPPFASGRVESWPGGLDAALLGCRLPRECPADPSAGQAITCVGYPAGSNHPSTRTSKVYMQRPGNPDTWIARIISPDEPVVTGMSGGAVLDADSNEPIGIIITRNSPADLNNDRDPDESLDFISLAGVWRAVMEGDAYV